MAISHIDPNTSAVEILTTAFLAGRPIVPFLGAGVSVATGFPSMTDITAYLAKVRYFIRRIVAAPGTDAEHLRDFGWPIFEQLNAALWRHLTNEHGRRFDDDGSDHLRVFTETLTNLSSGISPALSKTWATAWKCAWQCKHDRLELVTQLQHLEMLATKDLEAALRLVGKVVLPSPNRRLRVRGNWYELMMALTGGDFDLVDALFSQFGLQRIPASFHIFMSQLVDVLGLNLYLSLNFDSFLESALRADGYTVNVVEVTKDSDLPSPVSIGKSLSVLKLHGGAYSLRIGERIYETADANTLDRAMRLVPSNALVWVMGFSGDERRMSQVLVEHCRRAASLQPAGDPALLWMNFGVTPDLPLAMIRQVIAKHTPSEKVIAVRNYTDPSFLIFDLISRLRKSYPAGHMCYRAAQDRPDAISVPPVKDFEEAPTHLRLFECSSDWGPNGLPIPHRRGSSRASFAMSRFCGDRHNFKTIWIDCESHHTVEGITSDILTQIGRYDPHFQSLRLQIGSSTQDAAPSMGDDSKDLSENPHQDTALERIREALQRRSYILCIDSPETIGRLQTSHHGTPSLHVSNSDPTDNNFKQFTARTAAVFRFLIDLFTDKDATDIGESFVCIAVSAPLPRHGTKNTRGLEFIDQQVCNLRIVLKKSNSHVTVCSKPDPAVTPSSPIFDYKVSDIQSLFDLVVKGHPVGDLTRNHLLTILSMTRRPRSHLALLALLRDSRLSKSVIRFGDRQLALKNFDATQWHKLLILDHDSPLHSEVPRETEYGEYLLPGGFLWIPRNIHAAAYGALTDDAHADLHKTPGAPLGEAPESEKSVLSLIVSAVLHRRASRYYFSEVYEATGDASSFREYVYHRVSYLRTLRWMLTAIGNWGNNTTTLRHRFQDAIEAYYTYHDTDAGPVRLDAQLELVLDSWHGIREALRRIWLQELRAFRATLSREFESIRRNIDPVSWISTVELIAERDVYDLYACDAFSSGNDASPIYDLERTLLCDDLKTHIVRLRLEAGDWDGVVSTQLTFLISQIQKVGSHLLIADVLALGLSTDEKQIPTSYQDVFETFETFRKSCGAALKKKNRPLFAQDIVSADWLTYVSTFPNLAVDGKRKLGPSSLAGFVDQYFVCIDVLDAITKMGQAFHEMEQYGNPTRDHDRPETICLLIAGRITKRLQQWQGALETLSGTGRIVPLSKQIVAKMRTEVDERRLRLAIDEARYRFRRCSPWSDCHTLAPRNERACTYVLAPNDPNDPNAHLSDAAGKARILFELARRTVFDDRALYNLYRAKALRMLARTTILTANAESDFRLPLGQISRALRVLREGGRNDVLENVHCLRVRAEAMMLWSDMVLRGQERRLQDSIHFARTRLNAAQEAISNARNVLEQRPFNVVWAIRLFQDSAQYAVLSCTLRIYGCLKEITNRNSEQRAFYADVQAGLSAIRAGLDCLIRFRKTDKQGMIAAAERDWTKFAYQWLALNATLVESVCFRNKPDIEDINREARLWKLYLAYQVSRSSDDNSRALGLRQDNGDTCYAELMQQIAPRVAFSDESKLPQDSDKVRSKLLREMLKGYRDKDWVEQRGSKIPTSR